MKYSKFRSLRNGRGDDGTGSVWFNGAFVPWREAKVHVLTHALCERAVFGGERAYGGTIFKAPNIPSGC